MTNQIKPKTQTQLMAEKFEQFIEADFMEQYGGAKDSAIEAYEEYRTSFNDDDYLELGARFALTINREALHEQDKLLGLLKLLLNEYSPIGVRDQREEVIRVKEAIAKIENGYPANPASAIDGMGGIK